LRFTDAILAAERRVKCHLVPLDGDTDPPRLNPGSGGAGLFWVQLDPVLGWQAALAVAQAACLWVSA